MRRGGGVRGEITGFSRASRKRLLELAARLDVSGVIRPKFITLTMRAIVPPAVAKRWLDSWFKRLRRLCPAASAIWRLEFQKRGSPHFHLLVFGLPHWDKLELQRAWGEIINESRPFTRIDAVRHGVRGVITYAAKYMGKVPGVRSGLDNVTYLTGRLWGVHNRAALPVFPWSRWVLRWDFAVWLAAQYVAAQSWRGIDVGSIHGYSSFSADVPVFIRSVRFPDLDQVPKLPDSVFN